MKCKVVIVLKWKSREEKREDSNKKSLEEKPGERTVKKGCDLRRFYSRPKTCKIGKKQ